eukprot:5115127-Amphidinium_carterae.3
MGILEAFHTTREQFKGALLSATAKDAMAHGKGRSDGVQYVSAPHWPMAWHTRTPRSFTSIYLTTTQQWVDGHGWCSHG